MPRDCKNAYKDSNTCVKTYSESRKDTLLCRPQSGMNGSGIPLSQHITDLQGHLPRHFQRTEEDYSEEEEEEEDPRINPEDFNGSSWETRWWWWYQKKKSVIYWIACWIQSPQHLKTKAKNMCDILKCKGQISQFSQLTKFRLAAKLTEEATYEIILWIL